MFIYLVTNSLNTVTVPRIFCCQTQLFYIIGSGQTSKHKTLFIYIQEEKKK